MLIALKIAAYLLTLVGLWGLTLPAFRPYIRRTQQRMRRLSQLNKQKTSSTRLFRHLDQQLYLVDRQKYDQSVSVYRFLYRSLAIFAGSFLVSYLITSEIPLHLTSSNPFMSGDASIGQKKIGVGFSFILAIIAATGPYLILRIRYINQKVRAGWDLLDVVKTLARFGHLSLDTALIRTSESLPESNVLRRPLKILAFAMASHTHESEIRQESERFIEAIGTTFAVAFISDLMYAYRSGGEWQGSMLRLSEMMDNRQTAILNAKMEVSDAIGMGAYGNLLVIIFTCGGVAYLLGWSVYTQLQFQTVTGIVMLLLVLISTAVSMIISITLSKPRLDYR